MNRRVSIVISMILITLLFVLSTLAKMCEDEKTNRNYEGPRYVTVFSTEIYIRVEAEEETTSCIEETIERPTVGDIEYYDVELSKELQKYIIKNCEKYKISPALVMAIIERESECDAEAVGDNGNSLGLMQIQPKWHQWRADELGCLDWMNPYDNVTVGIHILAELFSRYGDDVYTVLMAYNGGAGYAKEMNAKGVISEYALKVNARAEELEHCDIAREEEKIWE